MILKLFKKKYAQKCKTTKIKTDMHDIYLYTSSSIVLVHKNNIILYTLSASFQD